MKVIPPSPVEGGSGITQVEALDERQTGGSLSSAGPAAAHLLLLEAKLSKRRFFDPVQFVEACRSLKLNFNVYHQNDAAEFVDQLLDRIETVTKG